MKLHMGCTYYIAWQWRNIPFSIYRYKTVTMHPFSYSTSLPPPLSFLASFSFPVKMRRSLFYCSSSEVSFSSNYPYLEFNFLEGQCCLRMPTCHVGQNLHPRPPTTPLLLKQFLHCVQYRVHKTKTKVKKMRHFKGSFSLLEFVLL